MAENPRSPLPEDPAYWDSLARKIGDDASVPLAAFAANQDAWYAVLARRAPWLVAASAAAMLGLWLALPPADSWAPLRWIENSVTPGELMGTFVDNPEPPSVDALLVRFPPAPDSALTR